LLNFNYLKAYYIQYIFTYKFATNVYYSTLNNKKFVFVFFKKMFFL